MQNAEMDMVNMLRPLVPDDTNNSNSLRPGGMIPEDEYNVPIPPRPGVPGDSGIPIPPRPGVPDDFGIPIPPVPPVPDDFGIPIPPRPGVPDDFGIPIPPIPPVPEDFGIPIPPRPGVPEDFGINNEKQVEDPDLKPPEDENNIPIPIPLEPEVPEDFGLDREEEVEDPDLKPLEDEDNLPNPPKPEVPEDFDISSDKQVEGPKPLEDEDNFPIPPEPEVPGVSGEKQVEDPDLKPLEDENNIPIPSKPEPAPLLEAEADITQRPGDTPEKNSEEDSLPPVEENTDEELMNPPPPVDQVMQNDQDKLASPKSETPVDAGIQNGIGVPTEDPMPKPEQEETLAPDEVQLDISKLKPAAEETQPEDDAIQPAEEGSSTPAEGLPSQSNQNAPSSTEPVVSKDSDTKINIGQAKVDKTTTYNWDILKSIVYGGLVESLTSLGVVSSAAASNASTLNIVALGLANLIGGLFVLAHNLKELKNEQYSASSDDSEETVDRYKETLGQREHFKRHVFFAVLSYIIFGLIPPVVYGFSFMESGNKYFKLLAVAAASIVCITVLAIGKAYVQTPSKKYVKTVLYYLVMGVLASGLSYVVGQLLQMLLDKLGLFNSSTATLTSTFLEMRPVEAGWASF